MSISFPNIVKPSYPLKMEREDNSITSKFDDGSMQSRRKFTRSRRKFSLSWDYLTQAEFETLDTFIAETVSFSAKTFEWVNPANNQTYTVRCTKYENAELKSVNFWSVSIELTEV